MPVDWAPVNDAQLRTFGQDVTHTAKLGVATIVTAIIESGVQPEDVPAGSGSTYARLWTKQSAFASDPEPGEEITVGTSIYKIVREEADSGGGVWLLLRFDREVV